ncbi:hypothetical protein [Azospirillum sp. sgz302134]
MDDLDRIVAEVSHLVARVREDAPVTRPAEPALSLDQKIDRIYDAIGGLVNVTDRLLAEVSDLKDRVTKLEIRTDTGFQVIAARLDEQRQTINAMIQ